MHANYPTRSKSDGIYKDQTIVIYLKKNSNPTYRENFRHPERGEDNHLKNASNFCRMSGQGGIVNFLHGRDGSFLEQPI